MPVGHMTGTADMIASLSENMVGSLIRSMFLLFFITLGLVMSRGRWTTYPIFWAITVAITYLFTGGDRAAADLMIAVAASTIMTSSSRGTACSRRRPASWSAPTISR